jgi:hypothetical protein
MVILMALASSAIGAGSAAAAVTPAPAVANLTFSTIPAVTLTSNPAPVPPATITIDWEITGPNGFSIDGSGTSPLALPAQVPGDDGPYTLRATDAGGTPAAIASFTIDRTPPAAPVVTSGPPAIVGRTAPFTFVWSAPGATSSHWQILDGVALITQGTVSTTQVTIPAPALVPGDRILNFRVSALDSVLNPSLFGSWHPFVVDQTPPGQPVLTGNPPVLTRIRTPSFTWLGTEAGGTFEWDVTEGGKSVLPPGAQRTTTDTSITNLAMPITSNASHTLVFRVRQVDPYGNRGMDRTYAFTIVPPLVAPPRTRWAKYMSPPAGRTGVSLRPVLTWRRIHAGTSVYNVQIYRGSVKVLSKFPTRNRFVVPPRALKRGVLYTWRVWSYIGKKKTYAPQPMTSYFITRT